MADSIAEAVRWRTEYERAKQLARAPADHLFGNRHRSRQLGGMTHGRQAVTDTKLLYSVTEAASVLGLGRTKVYEWSRAGVIRSVRIDGSRRIKAEDLRAYVARLGEAA